MNIFYDKTNKESEEINMKTATIKKANAKQGEELQEYLKIMRRHNTVPTKKGKGSKYDRQAFKRTARDYE